MILISKRFDLGFVWFKCNVLLLSSKILNLRERCLYIPILVREG
jgi:hypothetical protein